MNKKNTNWTSEWMTIDNTYCQSLFHLSTVENCLPKSKTLYIKSPCTLALWTDSMQSNLKSLTVISNWMSRQMSADWRDWQRERENYSSQTSAAVVCGICRLYLDREWFLYWLFGSMQITTEQLMCRNLSSHAQLLPLPFPIAASLANLIFKATLAVQWPENVDRVLQLSHFIIRWR